MTDVRSDHTFPLVTTLEAYQGAKVTNRSHNGAQVAQHLWHELVAVVTPVVFETSPHDPQQREDIGMVEFQPGLKFSMPVGGLNKRRIHVALINSLIQRTLLFLYIT